MSGKLCAKIATKEGSKPPVILEIVTYRKNAFPAVKVFSHGRVLDSYPMLTKVLLSRRAAFEGFEI